MIKGNATLVIDLGNSSTKCALVYGEGADGGKAITPFELSNKFGTVTGAEDEKNFEGYMYEYATDNDSTVFRYMGGYFCNGAIQAINFTAGALRPTAKVKKAESSCAIPSLMTAFIKAYDIIRKMEKVSSEAELDLTWNVVTLLPPGELDTYKDKMTQNIRSITHIDSVIPKMSLDININKVVILPEGLCAYMATVFDRGNKVRTDYKYLATETVLVADIGAGTTDFLLVSNNKLVQNSKYTVEMGGNQVVARLSSALKKAPYTMSIGKDKLEKAIVEGKASKGAQKVDITEAIRAVRKELGKELRNKIFDYFEEIDINTSDIGYIILCGGGAIADKSGVESLGYYVADAIKEITPSIGVVDLPVQTVQKMQESGNFITTEEKMSPRELNILGACIMAETLV